MFPPEDIKPIVEEIARLLILKKQSISVSEGACGGLISAYLVSVPGASQFFDGSRSIYSLKSRLKINGWNSTDINSYTVPSEDSVSRMARNLKIEFGSSYVLAESGFAGPSKAISSGGEGEVGTVYFGVTGPRENLTRICHTASSDRSENMQLFAKFGLEFILSILKEADEKEAAAQV